MRTGSSRRPPIYCCATCFLSPADLLAEGATRNCERTITIAQFTDAYRSSLAEQVSLQLQSAAMEPVLIRQHLARPTVVFHECAGMRAAAVRHRYTLGDLFAIEIEDHDLEARIAADPQFICVRIGMKRAVVAANTVGDILINRPVRLLHQIGVNDPEDLAAVMRRLTLADDVHFLVVPAEMNAIRPFDASPRHRDNLVSLAV